MVEDLSPWFFDFTGSTSKEQTKKGRILWPTTPVTDAPGTLSMMGTMKSPLALTTS
jgi:hypothetical protein